MSRNTSSRTAAASGSEAAEPVIMRAQEPPRPVDAEEPGGAAHRLGRGLLRPRRRRGHHRAGELGAERALDLLQRGTLSRGVAGEVGADLVPDASGARRGEGRDLQQRVAGAQGGADDLLLLVEVDAQFGARAGGQPECAEVDPRHAVVRGVGHVPRPAGLDDLAVLVLGLRRDAPLAQAAVDPVATSSERHVRPSPPPRRRRRARSTRDRPRRARCRGARRPARTARGRPAARPAAPPGPRAAASAASWGRG